MSFTTCTQWEKWCFILIDKSLVKDNFLPWFLQSYMCSRGRFNKLVCPNKQAERQECSVQNWIETSETIDCKTHRHSDWRNKSANEALTSSLWKVLKVYKRHTHSTQREDLPHFVVVYNQRGKRRDFEEQTVLLSPRTLATKDCA